MRWFWIDRFEEFISGERAVAIKNVTLAEDYVREHFAGIPMLPSTVILEGMAQTAGMLLGEHFGFRMRLVLAKVSSVQFLLPAYPGDTLRYTCTITRCSDAGGRIATTSHIDGKLQASGDFFLAMLPEGHEAEDLFDPVHFARLLRLLRIFEVGRTKDGQAISMPAELAAAEAAAGGSWTN
jgi:3-hydroxyacyl-[acyl-carrier-protein] dehydratase